MFPHTTLTALEAFPPITLEQARELLDLDEQLAATGLWKDEPRAAICVAFFRPGLVKWLVSANEADDTLVLMRKALERRSDETAT